MCFSAEADIVTGLAVTAVGIDTMRHVGHHREATLAVLPVIFGIHQLIEVPVWMGFEGGVSVEAAHTATRLYLLIAFGLIPWIVPLAVRLLEVDASRRRIMESMVGLGVVVSIALTIPVLVSPVSAMEAPGHAAYSAELVWGGPLAMLYVIVTCGALLASSDRVVRIYGGVNLVAVATLTVLLTTGVVSLWCVWAAVTSIAIAVHLRNLHHRHERAVTKAVPPTATGWW